MGKHDNNTAAAVPLDLPVTTGEATRKVIEKRLAELGKDMRWLSLACGMNHAYFHMFIKKRMPKRLPEQVRHRVARALEMEEVKLANATYADDAEAEAEARESRRLVKLHGDIEPYRLVMTKGKVEGWFKLHIDGPEFEELIRSLNSLRKPTG
jgi:hypothetical protein